MACACGDSIHSFVSCSWHEPQVSDSLCAAAGPALDGLEVAAGAEASAAGDGSGVAAGRLKVAAGEGLAGCSGSAAAPAGMPRASMTSVAATIRRLRLFM